MAWLVRFVRAEDGVDIVEYALLAALIAVGCLFAMKDLKTGIATFFGNVTTGLSTIF